MALFIKNVTVHNQVFVGRLIENQSGNGMHGIEPASGLINTLGNEVGRKGLIKQITMFKRVVQLGKRHRATVEPNINQLRCAVEAYTLPDKINFINKRFVQIKYCQPSVERISQEKPLSFNIDESFTQFSNGTDREHLSRSGIIANNKMLRNP